MCLALCACVGNSISEVKDSDESVIPEQGIDILGEWVCVSDNADTLTFKEDNSCQHSSGNSVKYRFDTELSVITLYDTITASYEIIEEDGIVKISGMKDYVRAEDYEIVHQVDVDNFFAEGKNGRTEQEYGVTYPITDQLTMTVHKCVRSENINAAGKNDLYFLVTVTNISDDTVCVREGYSPRDNKNYDSDLVFFSNIYRYHSNFVSLDSQGWLKKDLDDDYGDSSLVLTDEPIFIKSDSEKEFYIKIPDTFVQMVDVNGAVNIEEFDYHYAVFKFDNIELFCDTSKIQKSME